VRVCAIGDLLLDVTVALSGPLLPGDDVPAEIRVAAGGQAANVAAWAAALGARARLIAKRADDPGGRIALEQAVARGIEVVGPVAAGRTGTVVSLVLAQGERALASDRGVAGELRPEELDPAWMTAADVLHVSGYLLLEEAGSLAAARAAAWAHAGGGRVSVDLSSAAGIRALGGEPFRSRLAALAPDLVFASEEELAALGGEPDAPELVLKRGAGGVVHYRDGAGRERRALPGPVVDPTGAGDALAAGFLVGGLDLAVQAAARCLATMGALP
jgi:ribokinase